MAKVLNTIGSAASGDVFHASSGKAVNVSVTGTFVGTALLERSFDSGVTWSTYLAPGTTTAIFQVTTPGNTRLDPEPEDGVLYRLRVSAFTSGSFATRISTAG